MRALALLALAIALPSMALTGGRFAAFLLSPAGVSVLERSGFAPPR